MLYRLKPSFATGDLLPGILVDKSGVTVGRSIFTILCKQQTKITLLSLEFERSFSISVPLLFSIIYNVISSLYLLWMPINMLNTRQKHKASIPGKHLYFSVNLSFFILLWLIIYLCIVFVTVLFPAGSMETDLPIEQLSEHFNVNHFIVSQVGSCICLSLLCEIYSVMMIERALHAYALFLNLPVTVYQCILLPVISRWIHILFHFFGICHFGTVVFFNLFIQRYMQQIWYFFSENNILKVKTDYLKKHKLTFPPPNLTASLETESLRVILENGIHKTITSFIDIPQQSTYWVSQKLILSRIINLSLFFYFFVH